MPCTSKLGNIVIPLKAYCDLRNRIQKQLNCEIGGTILYVIVICLSTLSESSQNKLKSVKGKPENPFSFESKII